MSSLPPVNFACASVRIGTNPLNGWKLECPNGELNLVFSNGKESVENLSGI